MNEKLNIAFTNWTKNISIQQTARDARLTVKQVTKLYQQYESDMFDYFTVQQLTKYRHFINYKGYMKGRNKLTILETLTTITISYSINGESNQEVYSIFDDEAPIKDIITDLKNCMGFYPPTHSPQEVDEDDEVNWLTDNN